MTAVTGKLNSIKETITQRTGLDTSFVDDVDLRFQSLGYQLHDADAWMVGFAIQTVVNSIKNECNVSKISDGLNQAAVDMVCGEFLFAKKGSGQLDGFEIDLEAAVKQIHEGDTTIAFAIGEGNKTPEQRIDALINYLLNNGKGQMISFRRIKW